MTYNGTNWDDVIPRVLLAPSLQIPPSPLLPPPPFPLYSSSDEIIKFMAKLK